MSSSNQNVHVTIAAIVKQEGFRAAKKQFKDSQKAVEGLGEEYDATSEKVRKYNDWLKKNLITQKQYNDLLRRARMSQLEGAIPGLGRMRKAGAIGAGVGLVIAGIAVTNRLLRDMLDRAADAQQRPFDSRQIQAYRLGFEKFFGPELGKSMADSLADFAASRRISMGKAYQLANNIVAGAPNEAAAMQALAMRGLNPAFARMTGKSLDLNRPQLQGTREQSEAYYQAMAAARDAALGITRTPDGPPRDMQTEIRDRIRNGDGLGTMPAAPSYGGSTGGIGSSNPTNPIPPNPWRDQIDYWFVNHGLMPHFSKLFPNFVGQANNPGDYVNLP